MHHTANQPQDWREEALCTQTDPEIFFPEPGANATPARRICRACPVCTECLTEALNHRDVAFGVRGGLTPTQRRVLLNDQNRRAA